MASSSSNVVGVHYRVGKKIGEGSFGVIFEGTNLLNNQQVAIKFVSDTGVIYRSSELRLTGFKRNQERVMLHSSVMNTELTRFWSGAVSSHATSNVDLADLTLSQLEFRMSTILDRKVYTTFW